MKIIVTCSGGPDSMALLDMERKKGHEIVVCHVNYKRRESADRDEEIVRSYCNQYKIKMETLYPEYPGDENFQAWARKVRYDFFEEVARKQKIHHIYVAHQKDDVIETFFFQKERKMLCDVYGMEKVSKRKEFTIVRPLLKYEKKELEQYCQDHGISYGIDESNLENHYRRNQIRHSKIDYMDTASKNEVIEDIQNLNEKLKEAREKAKKKIKEKGLVSLLNEKEAWFYLDLCLPFHTSRKHLNSLVEQLKHPCLIDLGSYWLERFQNEIRVEKKRKMSSLTFSSVSEMLENPLFSTKGKIIQGMNLDPEDFPIVVRPVKEGDSIQLRYGQKKVHRFFIDRKISKIDRMKWLVVENVDKKVIFVPRIGCDVVHFSTQPNVFMLQCDL